MKIKSLCAQALHIPFRVNFKHNSAARSQTQSMLVKAQTEDGYLGVGEGCPREYVSGEDVASSLAFFSQNREELSTTIHRFDDLQDWVCQREQDIDANPAAWCAIELALLDALSKTRQESVEETLGVAPLDEGFFYTAVLGDTPPEVFQAQVDKYAAWGFVDFKLKITGNPAVDDQRFAAVLEGVEGARLRLDGNNLWRHPKEVGDYLERISIRPFALEEPLRAGDYGGLVEVADGSAVQIILDESFLKVDQFALLAESPRVFIINLRVSKMGGLIRSLAIVEQALALGIPLIVGAQVGETSILTRAALTIATACEQNLVAQEGAFGPLLLQGDVVEKPLVFGDGGRLNPRRFLNAKRGGFQMDYLTSV